MKLPEWIEKYMRPEVPFEGSWVKHDGEQYVLSTPIIEKWPDIRFDNIYDAYAYGRKTRGHRIYIHMSCPEMQSNDVDYTDYNRIKAEFKGPVPKKRGSFYDAIGDDEETKFFLMTPRCTFELYFEDAKKRETYFVKKHDFQSSYNYVTNHPVFWTRYAYEKYTGPYSWNKNSSEAIWSSPIWGKDGKYKWALEHGAHIPHTEYTNRYHDLRLDVYGGTIEEAYVMLADEVFKLWDFDGTEKEGNDV